MPILYQECGTQQVHRYIDFSHVTAWYIMVVFFTALPCLPGTTSETVPNVNLGGGSLIAILLRDRAKSWPMLDAERSDGQCSAQKRGLLCEHILQAAKPGAAVPHAPEGMTSEQPTAGEAPTRVNDTDTKEGARNKSTGRIRSSGLYWSSIADSEEREVSNARGNPITSTLRMGMKPTVPRTQSWSHCEFCALEGHAPSFSGGEHAGIDGSGGAEEKPDINGHANRRYLQGILFDPNGELLVESGGSGKIVMSEMKWASYFTSDNTRHTNHLSKIHAQISKEPFGSDSCESMVETPVFVFHLLTPQVGHLLVDVLESLFYTMLDMVGGNISEWSTNVILVIDVSLEHEQALFLELLLQGNRSPFHLLRAFTHHPIHTAESFARLEGRTCFSSLHVGLDISKTYYALGYDSHPQSLVPGRRAEDTLLLHRYGVFQQFLISFLLKDNREDADPDDLQPGESERGWVAAEESIAFGETETTGIEQDEPHTLEGRKRGGEELSGNSSSTLRITFIRRRGKRIITNYDALVGVAVAAATNATASPEPWSTDRSIPSRGDTSSTSNIKTWRDGMQGTPSERESHQHWTSWEVTECRLEDMDFSEQVKVLRRTDVLVAQYGTGLHNVFLMRPTSAVVLLMPPGWCEFAWQMANQAISSGLHVVAWCQTARLACLTDSWNDENTMLPLVFNELQRILDLPNREEPRSDRRPWLPATAEKRRWQRLRWCEQGWRQGTWRAKYAASTIGEGTFANLMTHAINLVGSASWPRLHLVETEVYDGLRLSRTVDHDDPEEIFAHIGDVVLGDVGVGNGTKRNPALQHASSIASTTSDYPNLVLKITPEVYTNVEDVHALFSSKPLEWCLAITVPSMESEANRVMGYPELDGDFCKPHWAFNERADITASVQLPPGGWERMLLLRAWIRDAGSGVDIPDSESWVSVPLRKRAMPSSASTLKTADVDSMPPGGAADSAQEVDMMEIDEIDATTGWLSVGDGWRVASGVLKLFPGGGDVYPMNLSRHFHVSLAWTAGRKRGSYGNPLSWTRENVSTNQTRAAVRLDLDGGSEEDLQRAIPRICRSSATIDCLAAAYDAWLYVGNTATNAGLAMGAPSPPSAEPPNAHVATKDTMSNISAARPRIPLHEVGLAETVANCEGLEDVIASDYQRGSQMSPSNDETPPSSCSTRVRGGSDDGEGYWSRTSASGGVLTMGNREEPAADKSVEAVQVARALDLPRRQHEPHSSRPFIFFHLDKCGGSTVRYLIVQAALRRRYEYHVPCFNETDYDTATCMQFDTSFVPAKKKPLLRVVGMHARNGWDLWQELPSVEREDDFDCLVILRHPVDRAISLFYHRLGEGPPGDRSLSGVDLTRLRDMILNARGVSTAEQGPIPTYLDEGMSDAACKMLSASNMFVGVPVAEATAGRRGTCRDIDEKEGADDDQHEQERREESEGRRKNSVRTPGDIEGRCGRGPKSRYGIMLAKTRLDRCVVGLLEEWEDTKRVMKFWFPWMEFTDDTVMNPSWWAPSKENSSDVPPAVRKAIEEENSCDLELYRHARDGSSHLKMMTGVFERARVATSVFIERVFHANVCLEYLVSGLMLPVNNVLKGIVSRTSYLISRLPDSTFLGLGRRTASSVPVGVVYHGYASANEWNVTSRAGTMISAANGLDVDAINPYFCTSC